MLALALLVLSLTPQVSVSQTVRDLQSFFREDVGLSEEQIANIRGGKAVVKAMPSRTPDEVFLFGAVYIHAAPESYVTLRHDFDRLRGLPNYLEVGVFSSPPQLSDLKDFSFDSDEIKSLRNCEPGECLIQMPASSIQELQQSVNWSAANADKKVNEQLQRKALGLLSAYQRDGNEVLGVYNDKRDPIDVAKQFEFVLSYSTALPARLPQFYNYLLRYPNGKPTNVEDMFYWARVKFGLKPTLRIVQVTTMLGKPGDDLACAIAEKQLYSSHYFEAALELSFCVRGQEDLEQRGFYLIMAMGSEQAGLTGMKGSIVRKAAVSRSVSNLQHALTSIRDTLEANN
ncbi:MAG: hypothetical protein WBL50_26520 [Candidatus Acidiferrum sp.]